MGKESNLVSLQDAFCHTHYEPPAVEVEAALEFWRQKLKGCVPVLQLPTDYPRPVPETYRGTQHTFMLDAELTRRLRQFGAEERVTLFMTLLANLKHLLYRYSGQTDVLVGGSMTNRMDVDVVDGIGHFTILPYRTDLSGDPSFREVIHRVRTTVLEGLQHGQVPLQHIVRSLRPEREISHAPFFEVLFMLHNASSDALEVSLPELKAEGQRVYADTTKCDLALEVTETNNDLHCVLTYNRDLFAPETAERLAQHFSMLLKSAMARPDHPIESLPMLTSVEYERLVVETNRTAAPYPQDKCVHTLFAEQATRTPDATAVICNGESLTYRQLDQQSNQWARSLSRMGVGPESLVGVCVHRGLPMIVSILAILKAGGAYLPLDVSYGEARILTLLEDAQCPLVLCDTDTQPVLSTCGCTLMPIDSEIWRSRIQGESVHPFDSSVQPANLAYVIYTSGSTGKPKGVMVEHRNVVAFLGWMLRRFDTRDLAYVLFSTSISFDISVIELFGPLSVGGTAVIIDNGLRLTQDPVDVPITLMNTVPSVARALAACDAIPPTLRVMVCGGERLSRRLVESLQTVRPDVEIINLYGPTEATVYSTGYTLPRNLDVLEGEPPIGRPLDNEQVFVLNQQLQPVPAGVIGELYIGGAGVTRGYLNRPALTAARFIKSPFHDQSRGRLYRTGDLVRFRHDGSLDYVGRTDSQVKVRGFRIELGEIEAALTRLSGAGVKEACVRTRETATGDLMLEAYVILERDVTFSEQALLSRLKNTLPSYMIPTRIMALAEFPLTQNGKIDRKALPEPPKPAVQPIGTKAATAADPPGAAAHGDAEVTEAERQQAFNGRSNDRSNGRADEQAIARMQQIWKAVLQKGTISLDDDFFRLGGHSLLAMQLFWRIEQEFGVKLPVSEIFRTRTIRLLTAALGQQQAVSPLVPMREGQSVRKASDGSSTEVPVFFIHNGNGGLVSYNDVVANLEGNGPVYGLQVTDTDAIRVSVEELAARYVQIIQEVSPSRTIQLVGHSAGGIIAYEMAQQLLRKGQEVACLCIVDSYGHTVVQPSARFRGLKRISENVPKLVKLPVHQWPGFVRDRLRSAIENERTKEDRILYLLEQSTASYKAAAYPGDLLLIQSEETTRRKRTAHQHRQSWESLIGGEFRAVEVEGNHISCLQLGAKDIAQALDEARRGKHTRGDKPAVSMQNY